MSLILLNIIELTKNNNNINFCVLPIRTTECGNTPYCHYKPSKEEVLISFNKNFNNDVIQDFYVPQKWLCSEFISFQVQQFLTMNRNFLSQIYKRNISMIENIKKLEDNDLVFYNIRKEINKEKSLKELLSFLENNNFYCYYSLFDFNEDGSISFVYAYIHDKYLIVPDENYKVIIKGFLTEKEIVIKDILDTFIEQESLDFLV